MRSLLIIFCGFLVSQAAARGGTGNPKSALVLTPALKRIVDMPANSWLSVPNTKMKAVTPTLKECSALGIKGMCGPRSVIDAWSGGAYDSKRDRLIIWGGGHNDYYGNELYAFDIPTLKWKRLTEPGKPRKNAYKVPGAFNADGTPASRHTYNTPAYIAHADRFFGHGGSMASGLGSSGFGKTFTFDFAKNKWHYMDPKGKIAPGVVSSFCAYDPVTRKIWYQDASLSRHRSWGLYSYHYDTNTWAKHNSDACASQTCVIDPQRRLLIGVGRGKASVWDIGKEKYARQALKTTGGEYIIKQPNPGVAYDPVSEKIVAWHGGPAYSLDMKTKVWTAHKASGAPTPAKWGTFGRWQYVPGLNAFIVVNGIDQNVFFYKLTAGGKRKSGGVAAPATSPKRSEEKASAASTDAKTAVKPVCPPDPAVVRTLESLGAGCSVVLPKFKITGDLNDVAKKWGLDKRGPEGRDYCAKMLWMPGRKRAAFCGANHAYPHRLNDVWEYDLPSNTWVCLYGPDMSKNAKPENWKDTVVDKNGIFRCKRGGPARIGHLWWQVTYDPDRRAITWMCCWGSSAAFAKALPAKMGGRHPDPSLWLYYPYERKWDPVINSKFAGRKPRGANASALEYIPDRKMSLWMKQEGTWSYTAGNNTWTRMKPNGGALKHGDRRSHAWEGVSVYVPSRKIVVSAGGDRPKPERKKWRGRTNVYSVATNTWKLVAEGEGVPWGATVGAPIVYDSVADVCLLYHNRLKQFWAFDIDKAKWSQITPKGPGLPGRIRPMSYYDPERNVWIIHRGNKIWAYRHKRRRAAR